MASSEVPSYDILYGASLDLTGGSFVLGISWCFMTCLYVVCMYNLIRDLLSPKATRKGALLTAWITALWILSSLSSLANAYDVIYAFSWQMGYPGGPTAYLADEWNASIPALAYSTSILSTWLADAMMLWRLFILYHGVHPLTRGLVLSFMLLTYVGTIGTGCFTIAILGSNQTLYSEFAMKAAIPYFTLSVTLNVFTTAFISTRLLLFKRLMERTLESKEARTSPFTSITAMLVGSLALYALWSLVFIITYAVNNPGKYILLISLCNVQVIAAVLIVYRVSKGIGWELTTFANLTSTQLLFSDPQPTLDTVHDLECQEGMAPGVVKTEFANPSQVASNTPSSSGEMIIGCDGIGTARSIDPHSFTFST